MTVLIKYSIYNFRFNYFFVTYSLALFVGNYISFQKNWNDSNNFLNSKLTM